MVLETLFLWDMALRAIGEYYNGRRISGGGGGTDTEDLQ